MSREVEHAAGVEVNQDAVTYADLKQSPIVSGCRVRRSWCLVMIASIFPASAAVSRASNPLRSTLLKADLCSSMNSPTTCQPRSSAYFLELANWSGMLRPSSDSRA